MSDLLNKLPDSDWRLRDSTRAVMAALEAARSQAPDLTGPLARFVGGCVRNQLLNQKVDDIDIATPLIPLQVIAALETAGIKAVPTGIDHGTITAVADGRPYEITTLRRDVETDGRRAVVAFSTDWTGDAQRRDFRLNAIYADADGTLFDPVGGIADALAGRVVFIGAAEDRIREDYLRILRFFRFSAWYGGGALDADGLAACARLADGMQGLSVERVWKEFKKLLAARDPRNALQAMESSGILRRLMPEAPGAAMLDRLIAAQLNAEPKARTFDPLPRFMALLLEEDKGAIAAARLKMSNEEKDRLAAGLSRDGVAMPPLSERSARAALYRLGPQAFSDRLVLALSNASGDADTARYKTMRAFAQNWTPPKLPVNGDDLARAGVKPGPAMGVTLRAVEQWWIDNDFPSDRKTLLAKAKELSAPF
ncbi:MAG: CCA tRNA nucleotidyltransferase [Caulobacterales bacterium]